MKNKYTVGDHVFIKNNKYKFVIIQIVNNEYLLGLLNDRNETSRLFTTIYVPIENIVSK